ncbi:MAG: hypothetical protein K0Q68_796 [Moraxellaceae bacterium]|nr:hypothetical protein [Moraxellaceae bacterium]
MSEGALFRKKLGDDWNSAPSHIQARFNQDLPPGTSVRYEGRMQVSATLPGKFLGWLMMRTGALMPYEGEDVPVFIEVWTDEEKTVHKRRTYSFPGKPPFVFQSRMQLLDDGRIAEHVGGGLGMYVSLRCDSAGLHFTDAGYFMQVATIRLPLPSALGPGRVVLAHLDVGAEEFDVKIDISHPLFGKLFTQSGRFRHVSPSSV